MTSSASPASPTPSAPLSLSPPEADAPPRADAPQFPGRTLPHSLEAEGNLLSCCLADGRGSVSRCIAAKLCPASFYDARYGGIFAALLALHARQDAIDPATVAIELQTTRELDQVGGYALLTEVSKYQPTGAQLNIFIRTVREMWILREVIRAATKTVEDCHAYTGDLAALLGPHVGWFQSALTRVVHGERGGLSLRERVAEVKSELAARAAGTEDRSRWVHTGLARFDERLRPLGSDAEDHVVLVGGASGHGKSALMRQWAGTALSAGQTVLNYTRETSVKGWIRQLASAQARVDLRTLAQAPADHAANLQAECDRLAAYMDKTLFVYQHEAGCGIETVEELVLHARSWAWQHGAPHLMVIDYLQLFATKKRTNNREQEVAHVSHTLQALQRELGCVLLIGAQLNESGLREMRTAKKTEDGRLQHRLPTPGDFRESQAMYHDADRVIAIYRPPEDCCGRDNYGPDVTQPEQWLVQIKRRYGGEGSSRCWFHKRTVHFQEFGRAEETSSASAPSAPAGAPPPAATAAEKLKQLAAKKAGHETGEPPY